ncbi:hypothetical protein ANCCAN_20157 [Ancylostoma caninum]|uniref:Peptidase M13 N-terminal domain-containing protein n=1 Tax=Ancylostoma caninum TaxID=29170 RepID=A0A368FSM0_ANCCA|nr:hypothetical protein ANCCAN_20157 [Ancylostoma caninum]
MKIPPKAEHCFASTLGRFRDALIAEYARRTNGTRARNVIDKMKEALAKEFKDTIRENSWLDKSLKEVSSS